MLIRFFDVKKGLLSISPICERLKISHNYNKNDNALWVIWIFGKIESVAPGSLKICNACFSNICYICNVCKEDRTSN